MRRILPSFVLLGLFGGLASPCHAGTFVLVDEGRPVSEIVLPLEPTKSAQLAAYELREHIRLITGAELAIVNEDDQGDGVKLHVGDTRAARAAGLSQEQFLDQEYAVRRVPGGIVLAGKDSADTGEVVYKKIPAHARHEVYDYLTWPSLWSERGTLHAAYAFLRTACGVRWFDPTDYGTDYQERQTLEVAVPNLRTRPAFAHRDFFAGYENAEFFDTGTSLWHQHSEGYAGWEASAYAELRRQFSSPHVYRNVAKRGRIKAFLYRHMVGGKRYRCNHSLYGYYPRFWEQDPNRAAIFEGRRAEWFAQGHENLPRPPQMCYSNPSVVRQVVQDAEAWFSGTPISPNSGLPITRQNPEWTSEYFPLVPMDNGFWCQCPDCTAQLHPRSSKDLFSNGTASDHVWRFVDTVARRVGKTSPGKYIAALAYASYAFPPRDIQLADNISVQLCLHIRAVYDTQSQATDRWLLEQWHQNPDRPIFLWLYYCFPSEWCNRTPNPDTWHCFPGFFAHSISKAFRKYAAHNVQGMFFNGIGQEVENYVTLRLLQDPHQDVDVLLDDYFSRMYGPAAPAISQLYHTIEAIYSDPANNVTSGAANAWEFQGTVPRMAEMAAMIEAAEQAGKQATPIQRKRLELFKLAVWDYMTEGKAKHSRTLQTRRIIGYCPAVPDPATSDPGALNWSRDAQAIDGVWRQDALDGSRRDIRTFMLHDGTSLYIALHEHGLTSVPESGDRWRLLFASPEGETIRECVIGLDGVIEATGIDKDAVQVKSNAASNRWETVVTLPLAGLLPAEGRRDAIRFNCVRLSANTDDEPVLMPTAGNLGDATRYASITLGRPVEPAAAEPLDARGLVLHWDFADADNPGADRSPLKNHATATPSQIQRKDWFGGDSIDLTPSFPGEKRHFDVVAPQGFDGLKTAMTFAFWLKVAPHPTYNRPAEYYTLLDSDNGLYLDLRPEGRVFFRAGGKPFEVFAPARTLTPDAWQHLVITCGDGYLSVYVNARLTKRVPYTIDLHEPLTRFRVGQLLKPMNHFQFTGELGEVAVFTRAVSAGEVAALYSAKDKGQSH